MMSVAAVGCSFFCLVISLLIIWFLNGIKQSANEEPDFTVLNNTKQRHKKSKLSEKEMQELLKKQYTEIEEKSKQADEAAEETQLLQEKLTAANKEISEVRETLGKCELDLFRERQRTTSYKSEITDLREANRELNESSERLTSQFESHSTAVAEKAAQCKRLENQLLAYAQKCNDLEARAKSSELAIVHVRRHVELSKLSRALSNAQTNERHSQMVVEMLESDNQIDALYVNLWKETHNKWVDVVAHITEIIAKIGHDFEAVLRQLDGGVPLCMLDPVLRPSMPQTPVAPEFSHLKLKPPRGTQLLRICERNRESCSESQSSGYSSNSTDCISSPSEKTSPVAQLLPPPGLEMHCPTSSRLQTQTQEFDFAKNSTQCQPTGSCSVTNPNPNESPLIDNIFAAVKQKLPSAERITVVEELFLLRKENGKLEGWTRSRTVDAIVAQLWNKSLVQELNGETSKLEDECPICHEFMNAQSQMANCPHCRQPFHSNCVNKWLEQHKSDCPMCRSLWLSDVDFPHLGFINAHLVS